MFKQYKPEPNNSTSWNDMKMLKLFVESFFVSLIFNLIGNNGFKLNRFLTPAYWTWTLAFTLAIVVAALLIRVRLKVLWIHWQKKYPQLQLFRSGRVETNSLPKSELVWAILSTSLAVLMLYLCFIFLIAFVRSGSTYMLFINYLFHYTPFVATGCLVYVSYVFIGGQLWWLTPTNALALFSDLLPEKIVPVEKVVTILPPSALDKSIPIGSLYDVLYLQARFDLSSLQKDAVRMFDVPFYFSKKGKKQVVLIDGTRLEADHFLKELETRGLDKWFFRISSTCRVNMMHIRFPISPNATQLEFRKEVFQSLRLKMTAMEIGNLLQVTEWMRKEKKLKDFLDDVHHLRHKGWDQIIPLN